jgi:sugar/nucleoside kinase (ribokinase family)
VSRKLAVARRPSGRSTRPARGANRGGRFDYTAVGHVTVDVMSDGSRRPGGSAFYSALQASRLGRRTLILTRGAAREIEELVEPYRDELELQILPAPRTTTLQNSASGLARKQRLLAWAGPIDDGVRIDTSILQLAPVARETPGHWQGRADFVGLTPQGLVRGWKGEGEEISLLAKAPAERLPERWDALVLSEAERASCAALICQTRAAGGVVAITAGSRPTTVLMPGEHALEVGVAAVPDPSDDLGAGDVFAAAFFIALAEGRSADAAAAFANAAASVRLGGLGGQAIGDRAQIEARSRAAAARR